MSSTPQPDRPVFIIGPHRSGTTVLYGLLGRHRDVGYFNPLAKKVPRWPWLASKAKRLGLPDHPVEAQAIWDDAPGIDDLRNADEATPDVVRHFRGLVARTLAHRGASRFVAKYPRLSFRLPWLETIFPDAIFVHLVRDWRAVVNSTVARHEKRQGRERSWFGVRPRGWRALAGRPLDEISTWQYVQTAREIERHAPSLGQRYLRVRYDRLCADPFGEMRAICAHADLPYLPGLERAVARKGLVSRDDKWRERLTAARVEVLRAIAPELLSRHEVEAVPVVETPASGTQVVSTV